MVNRTLTGTYDRILDEKFRIAIPKTLRKDLSEQLELVVFVVPGMDKCLDLYPEEAFAERSRKFDEHAANQPESRDFFRMLFAPAAKIAVDPQGRIRIPDRLASYAGLKHDIVLCGVRDHVEIWEKTLWEEYFEKNIGKLNDLGSHALYRRSV
jgi:MraZ protein